MSRTIRSSAAAHEQMAARVQTQAQTREDFRRVLARRDSKRAAVRNAPARGSVRFGALLAMAGTLAASLVLAAASVGLTGAHAFKRGAAPADCSAPVQACEGARACARMVSDC